MLSFQKRKRKRRWAKPSNEEVNKAKQKMAKTNVKVCGIYVEKRTIMN